MEYTYTLIIIIDLLRFIEFLDSIIEKTCIPFAQNSDNPSLFHSTNAMWTELEIMYQVWVANDIGCGNIKSSNAWYC